MAQALNNPPDARAQVGDDEWYARVGLAGAYGLVDYYGRTDW